MAPKSSSKISYNSKGNGYRKNPALALLRARTDNVAIHRTKGDNASTTATDGYESASTNSGNDAKSAANRQHNSQLKRPADTSYAMNKYEHTRERHESIAVGEPWHGECATGEAKAPKQSASQK